MKPWAHLPNAHHIDWVIQFVRSNIDVWVATDNAIRITAWREAWDAAYYAARVAARDAAYDAAWTAAYDAAREAARVAAANVILALIAYDDCDWYLAMTYEQLSVYAVLSDKPQAVLLLPMKWIQENETPVTAT